MNPIPARAIAPPTASTSWLPAGPTTATMPVFEMSCWVTVTAIAGLSCVSPWTSFMFVLLAVLSIATASWAKCSCSVPRNATGPVIGPSNPIDALHALVAVPLDDPPPLAPLLLLLLAQPVTASEPSAATAMIRRPFIGYASISVISHYVGVNIARILRWRAIRRHVGRRGVLRRGAAFAKLTALPTGRIRTVDQTIAVYAKARGLMWDRAGSCEFDTGRAAIPGEGARGGRSPQHGRRRRRGPGQV